MSEHGTIFKDWQWGECLEYLNNIIHHSDNIALVSGERSSGKTILKQELMRGLLLNKCKCCTISGESKLNLNIFMHQVCVGFGIKWENNSQPDWDELRKEIFHGEYNWVLLIDDAEKLSWEALSALIDLYITVTSEGSKFNLILFADLYLKQNLLSSPLKDFFEVKFNKIYLESLNFQQMIVFLYEHMQLDFNRKTLQKIFNASGGIIGKIKQLAIAESTINKPENTSWWKNLLKNIISPTAARLIICLGLLAVAGGLFYLLQQNNSNSTQLPSQLPPQQATTAPGSTNNFSEEALTENIPQTNRKILTENITKTTSEIVEPMHTDLEENKPKINSTYNDDTVKYDQLYDKLFMALNHNLQEQLAQLTAQINQLNNLKQPNNSKNVITPQAIITTNSSSNVKLTTTKSSHKVTTYKENKSNEQKLLNTPQKFYALQLMASKQEQSVINLIKTYPGISQKIKYFSGKFNPKAEKWYIAIYGSYPTPELAIKDIRNLPPTLQKLKPLARDYASIHTLIKNDKTNK